MSNSSSYKQAFKLSLRDVPETCPHVDAALESAANAIKEQTGALRDAMVEWIERALNAEEKIEELQREIEELQYELKEALNRD